MNLRSIGVIGCGNMGGALLKGFANKANNYILNAYTKTPSRMQHLIQLGVHEKKSAKELAQMSDLIILAVKPYQVANVIRSIEEVLTKEKILLSIAAGISLSMLGKQSNNLCPCVRCMPNTPALVGKGVFAFAFSQDIEDSSRQTILNLFTCLGLSLEIPEEKFAAFSSLLGAGPAFVVTMMDAMVQAGVTLGFSQDISRTMICELFEGTALWAKSQNCHLRVLRDAVCSPAGLTIDGVNDLERNAFCGITIDAVLAAYKKASAMEKDN